MAEALYDMSEILLTHRAEILHRYRADCITLGQDVQLLRNDTVRYAHVRDMDSGGALIVTLEDGTEETVFSGEVSVRGIYGYV